MLNIARSIAYYCPIGIADDELTLRKLIDKMHLEPPYMGSWRISTELFKLGKNVNRKRVIRLMIAMGIGAVYPKQRTTIADKSHKIYPYLLRDLDIVYVNQVWAIHHLYSDEERFSLSRDYNQLV